jgi:GTP-binding protein
MEKIQSAEFLRSAILAKDFLPSQGVPEVAFVGRSNVGKSTLLNTLLRRKALARTSSTPGRTQAVNYFRINNKFNFVDLPGYGYAKISKDDRRRWARLMDEYFSAALPRAVVVLLIDAKVQGTVLDRQANEYLVSLGANPIYVATKIDKVPRGKRIKALRELRERVNLAPEQPLIEFSATTQEGVKDLWREIAFRQESL